VTSLGIGTIWAYHIFYTAYQTACHSTVQQAILDTEQACRLSSSGRSKSSSSSSDDLVALERSLFQLQGAMQRRSHAECHHRYGAPPYHVQFHIQLQDAEHIVEVELNRVDDRPFTTDTFFQLVEYGLYTETTMGPSSSSSSKRHGKKRVILGGNPSDAPTKVRSQLLRSYAELGYGTQPFVLVENDGMQRSSSSSSRVDCEKYSFGFDRKTQGPEFIILLDDPEESLAENVQCIGRVAQQSWEVIERLQAQKSATAAKIVEVRITGMDNARQDEL
jgi:hypothetical protein